MATNVPVPVPQGWSQLAASGGQGAGLANRESVHAVQDLANRESMLNEFGLAGRAAPMAAFARASATPDVPAAPLLPAPLPPTTQHLPMAVPVTGVVPAVVVGSNGHLGAVDHLSA